ncbi:MAG: cell division protein FtsA [Patescibacteria group bacterium]|nr:cell division protein FtsA [Patescibacteria group bacterium]
MPRQRIIAAIDIGSSKTSTVIASIGEDEKINVIGASSVFSRGINRGQIVNIEQATETVIEAVEAAERMAGYNLTRVLISVSGPHIGSQNSHGVVAVAEPEGEICQEDVLRVIDAAKAISLPSSREVIHVLPRFFIVDGQEGINDPVGMSGTRLEVQTHIISGASSAMRNLAKCVSEIGADVQSLVFSGIASAEAVLTETEKDLGVVLVDIGGGVTKVSVFVEGSPFYDFVLPIGAINVTKDIAAGLGLSSLDVAEKIKIALSKEIKKPVVAGKRAEFSSQDEILLKDLGIKNVGNKKISRKTLVDGIIKPRLNEIFSMIASELKKAGVIGLTPSGVVLTGGGALTIGVKIAARQSLSMPVRIGYPRGVWGLVDEVKSPEYSVVVGLLKHASANNQESAGGFKIARFGKKIKKLPFKGISGKIAELVKTFLP